MGVDYRFETKFFYDGVIQDGCLEGDLYLKGGGDPELSAHDLDELAFQLQLLGVKKMTGKLYVDISDFDAVAEGPGWMWDDRLEPWSAPIDALSMNHNCMQFWIKPSLEINKPPLVYMVPKITHAEVRNFALTSGEVDDLYVEPLKTGTLNVIEVKGHLPQDSAPRFFQVAVNKPHLLTAETMRTILLRKGIEVSEKILVGTTPQNAVCIATHYSTPLAVIVQSMLKHSDNLIADTVFKKIGQIRFNQTGSWRNGSKAVKEFLDTEVRLEMENMVILDGSGLSRYNLVSPRHLVKLLCWVNLQFPYASEFFAALAMPGKEGTLKKRMVTENLHTKVRAKTGSMQGVSSMSGYVKTKHGEWLAFAIMINGFTKPAKEYKTKIEDQICALLADL
jgi:D-alanyl-D-alanine carboxypeptidase/D-alanyl-D-alanine-endopeptidase (penicillin-binding protein 4)